MAAIETTPVRIVSRLPGRAQASVAVWQMDEGRELVRLDRGAAAVLGLSLVDPEAISERWRSRIYKGHLRRYERTLALVHETGGPLEVEYRTNAVDSEMAWLRDHLTFDATTRSYLGVTTRIDSERAAEEGLGFLNKASRIFASSLVTSDLLEKIADLVVDSVADICIVETELDGEPIVVCRTNRRGLAAKLSAQGCLFVGRNRIPAALRRGRWLFHQVLKPGQAKRLLGEERLGLFGRRQPHTAISAAITARGQQVGFITLLCTDIKKPYSAEVLQLVLELCRQAGLALQNARTYSDAEHREIELALENEAKDEFLGILSHELRTPLTVIYGVSRMLPRLLPPVSDETQALVHDLVNAAGRTVQLMDDLMLLARLNLGEAPELEPVPTQMILREVSGDFRRLYPDNLLTTDDTLRAYVSAAPAFLKQVLTNLLSNAQKYARGSGEIILGAHESREGIRFYVKDTGSGLPEEELTAVFERFYRSSNSSGVSGAGLGLRICKRFVEAQRGRIWAENAPGGGLIVSVLMEPAKQQDF